MGFVEFMLCLIAIVVILTMAKVREIHNFLTKGKMQL